MPIKDWRVNYKITTHKGRVLSKQAVVSDPAKHFAEYMKRFHPTAKRIEWEPMDVSHRKPTGPKRWVEFDKEGKVVARGPDIDAAHVGGHDWQPDEKNPDHSSEKGGDSRKGIDPADPAQRDIGRHPTASYEDEEAEEMEMETEAGEETEPK